MAHDRGSGEQQPLGLVEETTHLHGSLGLAPEGESLIVRTTGKNLLTRRTWLREEPFPLASLKNILVQSRDRRTFTVEAFNEFGRSQFRLEGFASKTGLDQLFRRLTMSAPHIVIELAHPS